MNVFFKRRSRIILCVSGKRKHNEGVAFVKRIISVIVLLLLLICGCAMLRKDAAPETSQEQMTEAPQVEIEKKVSNGGKKEYVYILKSFDYYHNGGSVFNTFEFLKNPTEAKDKYLSVGEKFGFRFIDKDGQLFLRTMSAFGKNQYYDMYGFFAYRCGFFPNEQCSDAIAFLCDEEAIKKCFSENGVKDIREIIILRFSDHKTGYVAVALTENEAYYMTVPVADAEYGDYIHQKVYTSEEFKKIYSPREADVYIDGKKMDFPVATMLGEKYIELDAVSFLSSLGHECTYDVEKQEITAGEYKIKLEYNKAATELRKNYGGFIEPAPEYTVTIKTAKSENKGYSAVIRNGRVLIGYECLEALCETLNYDYKYNYDDYSVYLDDSRSEVTLRDEVNFYPYKLRDEIGGYKLKWFGYYHNEGGIYNTFAFLQNPFVEIESVLNGSGEHVLFKEVDGKLVLSALPGHNEKSHVDLFSSPAVLSGLNASKHCSEAVAFLCDEEAIKKCFFENGVGDIRKIEVLSFMDEKVGYIAVALTENEAYYMTIPLAEAEYGDYIYQKVYTSEEFKKIYSPRAADVYIDGEKMDFPVATMLGEKYLEMDMLSFLEALGYECTYDEEKQEITAGEYKIKLEYDEESTSYRNKYKEFLESAPEYDVTVSGWSNPSPKEWAVLKNGRFLASQRVIEGFCNVSGYEITYQYDDMSVHIFKK